jgi:hypothetical protein
MSTTPQEKLSDLVKRVGITAIAAEIIKSDSAYSITEHELTTLVTERARRDYPTLSPAQAFTRVFTEQSDAGVVLRKAFAVVKNGSFEDVVDDDSNAAYREIEAIAKRDFPHLRRDVRFTKVFESRPDLSARAHRRPGASTSFPHPVAKAPLVPTANLTPAVSDNLDVDSPQAALERLKRIGASMWPTKSEAEQLINAVADLENAALVSVWTGSRRSTGSSPPRS